jgi:Methyltransferase domain
MQEGSSSARKRFEAALREPSDIRHHLRRLRREARGTVLELGVRGGNSTTALLAGLEERGGKLWSVDVDSTCAGLFTDHPQWKFVTADSRDCDPVVRSGLGAAELDVLFVDTLHTYEQVRDELAVWGDRIRSGGTILFHDTESYPEIRRAIAEWCRPRRIPFEFFGRSNGLGVAYPGRGGIYGGWLAWVRLRRRVGWTIVASVRGAAQVASRIVRRLQRELTRRLLKQARRPT